MGEIISVVIIIFCSMLIIFSFWVLKCINKTYEQRIKLIPDTEDENFYKKIICYRKVTYNEHLFRLILFRDPYLLYNPIVFEPIVFAKEKDG